MKKSAFITLIASMAIITPAMASCGGGSDAPDQPQKTVDATSVSVSPESIELTSDAQTAEIKIKGNGVGWGIASDSDWVTLNMSGGVRDVEETVKVTVSANTSFESRTATLSIRAKGDVVKTVRITQAFPAQAVASMGSMTFGGQASSYNMTVTANTAWTITGNDWITVSPSSGKAGETEVTVSAKENTTADKREGVITLKCGSQSTEIKVSQLSDAISVPEGYALVWNDEFNEGTQLNAADWTHEVQGAGWVNNELQNYISGEKDGKRTTEIKNGFLNINCFKASDGKVYSGRVYAHVNTGWTYGYFEARIKLPKGKGTWPAYWMMPCNVDWTTNGWPNCGEIDIMEEVGVDANQVSSSLHTGNYNHTKGTQKTHAMSCPGAEDNFHVYALEWSEDAITTYVDGKVQLKATKAEMGSDHASWPFHYAFYPIFNLAWGGDWGGYAGVDEKALPVTMQVDYIRVFQKK